MLFGTKGETHRVPEAKLNFLLFPGALNAAQT